MSLADQSSRYPASRSTYEPRSSYRTRSPSAGASSFSRPDRPRSPPSARSSYRDSGQSQPSSMYDSRPPPRGPSSRSFEPDPRSFGSRARTPAGSEPADRQAVPDDGGWAAACAADSLRASSKGGKSNQSWGAQPDWGTRERSTGGLRADREPSSRSRQRSPSPPPRRRIHDSPPPPSRHGAQHKSAPPETATRAGGSRSDLDAAREQRLRALAQTEEPGRVSRHRSPAEDDPSGRDGVRPPAGTNRDSGWGGMRNRRMSVGEMDAGRRLDRSAGSASRQPNFNEPPPQLASPERIAPSRTRDRTPAPQPSGRRSDSIKTAVEPRRRDSGYASADGGGWPSGPSASSVYPPFDDARPNGSWSDRSDALDRSIPSERSKEPTRVGPFSRASTLVQTPSENSARPPPARALSDTASTTPSSAPVPPQPVRRHTVDSPLVGSPMPLADDDKPVYVSQETSPQRRAQLKIAEIKALAVQAGEAEKEREEARQERKKKELEIHKERKRNEKRKRPARADPDESTSDGDDSDGDDATYHPKKRASPNKKKKKPAPARKTTKTPAKKKSNARNLIVISDDDDDRSDASFAQPLAAPRGRSPEQPPPDRLPTFPRRASAIESPSELREDLPARPSRGPNPFARNSAPFALPTEEHTRSFGHEIPPDLFRNVPSGAGMWAAATLTKPEDQREFFRRCGQLPPILRRTVGGDRKPQVPPPIAVVSQPRAVSVASVSTAWTGHAAIVDPVDGRTGLVVEPPTQRQLKEEDQGAQQIPRTSTPMDEDDSPPSHPSAKALGKRRATDNDCATGSAGDAGASSPVERPPVGTYTIGGWQPPTTQTSVDQEMEEGEVREPEPAPTKKPNRPEPEPGQSPSPTYSFISFKDLSEGSSQELLESTSPKSPAKPAHPDDKTPKLSIFQLERCEKEMRFLTDKVEDEHPNRPDLVDRMKLRLEQLIDAVNRGRPVSGRGCVDEDLLTFYRDNLSPVGKKSRESMKLEYNLLLKKYNLKKDPNLSATDLAIITSYISPRLPILSEAIESPFWVAPPSLSPTSILGRWVKENWAV